MQTNHSVLASLCKEINQLKNEIDTCTGRSQLLILKKLRSENALKVMEFIKHSIRNYIGLHDFLIIYLIDALDSADLIALGIEIPKDQSKHGLFNQLKISLMKEFISDQSVNTDQHGRTLEIASENLTNEGIAASPNTIEKYYKKLEKLVELFKTSGLASTTYDENSQPLLNKMPEDYRIKAFLYEIDENARIRRFTEGEELVCTLGNSLKNFYKS